MEIYQGCNKPYGISDFSPRILDNSPRIRDHRPGIWDHTSRDQDQQILVGSGIRRSPVLGIREQNFRSKNGITDEKRYLVTTLISNFILHSLAKIAFFWDLWRIFFTIFQWMHLNINFHRCNHWLCFVTFNFLGTIVFAIILKGAVYQLCEYHIGVFILDVTLYFSWKHEVVDIDLIQINTFCKLENDKVNKCHLNLAKWG